MREPALSLRPMLIRLLPALVFAALLALGVHALSAPAAGVPRLPDLDQEPPSELVITRAKGEYRLGFRSAVRNIGAGPLIITGSRPDRGMDHMVADQSIEQTDAPEQLVRGVGRLRYVVSPDHRHWHYLGFERYELARPDGRTLVRDRKSGFCLGDRYTVDGMTPANAGVHVALRARRAGPARDHRRHLRRLRRRLPGQPRGPVPEAERPPERTVSADPSRQRRSQAARVALRQRRRVRAVRAALAQGRAEDQAAWRRARTRPSAAEGDQRAIGPEGTPSGPIVADVMGQRPRRTTVNDRRTVCERVPWASRATTVTR